MFSELWAARAPTNASRLNAQLHMWQAAVAQQQRCLDPRVARLTAHQLNVQAREQQAQKTLTCHMILE